MEDLISRTKLLNNLRWDVIANMDSRQTMAYIYKVINGLPSEPSKRGYWKYYFNKSSHIYEWTCSECGFIGEAHCLVLPKNCEGCRAIMNLPAQELSDKDVD